MDEEEELHLELKKTLKDCYKFQPSLRRQRLIRKIEFLLEKLKRQRAILKGEKNG